MPRTFTPITDELFAVICSRIADGETLSAICREPDMPGRVTVYEWMAEQPERREQFARARDQGFDRIAESTLAIADEEPPTAVDGRRDAGTVAWQKNRIWTRLQLLAKWDPRRYGDRQAVDLTNSDGSLRPSDTEAAARMAAIMTAAAARRGEADGSDLA